MINGVTTTPADLLKPTTNKTAEAGERTGHVDRDESAEKPDVADSGDRVTLGSKAAGAVHAKPVSGESPLDARLMVMRELVARMFEKQGQAMSIDIGDGRTSNIKDITPGQAAGLVSDDGYWGVDKTAQRIVDFAINAAGGDPTRLDAIKKSVLKGFSMAERAFGGSLPDISRKTLDAAMSRLDRWAKEQDASHPAAAAGSAASPA